MRSVFLTFRHQQILIVDSLVDKLPKLALPVFLPLQKHPPDCHHILPNKTLRGCICTANLISVHNWQDMSCLLSRNHGKLCIWCVGKIAQSHPNKLTMCRSSGIYFLACRYGRINHVSHRFQLWDLLLTGKAITYLLYLHQLKLIKRPMIKIKCHDTILLDSRKLL